MKKCSLDIEDCREQGYHGAANRPSSAGAVQGRIKETSKKSVALIAVTITLVSYLYQLVRFLRFKMF